MQLWAVKVESRMYQFVGDPLRGDVGGVKIDTEGGPGYCTYRVRIPCKFVPSMGAAHACSGVYFSQPLRHGDVRDGREIAEAHQFREIVDVGFQRHSGLCGMLSGSGLEITQFLETFNGERWGSFRLSGHQFLVSTVTPSWPRASIVPLPDVCLRLEDHLEVSAEYNWEPVL